jgi:hypothetical protein
MELQLHNTPFEEYIIEMNSIFVESFVDCKQWLFFEISTFLKNLKSF